MAFHQFLTGDCLRVRRTGDLTKATDFWRCKTCYQSRTQTTENTFLNETFLWHVAQYFQNSSSGRTQGVSRYGCDAEFRAPPQ